VVRYPSAGRNRLVARQQLDRLYQQRDYERAGDDADDADGEDAADEPDEVEAHGELGLPAGQLWPDDEVGDEPDYHRSEYPDGDGPAREAGQQVDAGQPEREDARSQDGDELQDGRDDREDERVVVPQRVEDDQRDRERQGGGRRLDDVQRVQRGADPVVQFSRRMTSW